LIRSDRLEDNVAAILGRMRDARLAVRQILSRIAEADVEARAQAIAELIILAGLRRLGDIIGEEIQSMPILDDIMDHDLLGPAYRKGIAEGRHEGWNEGRNEGRSEGRVEEARTILQRQIAKRFGGVPDWAERRIAAMSQSDVEELALRIFEANTVDQLF
jgi:predicted transposase YdaD